MSKLLQYYQLKYHNYLTLSRSHLYIIFEKD